MNNLLLTQRLILNCTVPTSCTRHDLVPYLLLVPGTTLYHTYFLYPARPCTVPTSCTRHDFVPYPMMCTMNMLFVYNVNFVMYYACTMCTKYVLCVYNVYQSFTMHVQCIYYVCTHSSYVWTMWVLIVIMFLLCTFCVLCTYYV